MNIQNTKVYCPNTYHLAATIYLKRICLILSSVRGNFRQRSIAYQVLFHYLYYQTHTYGS